MQIIFHTGAHFTEEDRLMKCLLRNKEDFGQRGIAVPGPGKYRPIFTNTLNALAEADPAPDARDILLDAILDAEEADRLILSNAHFFGAPRTAIRRGHLYPMAPERVDYMRRLFPDDDVEIFMAIRNPVSFLPAAFEQSPRVEFDNFIGGVDPRTIRWSDMFARVRAMAPDVPITVWCHEDLPLIWAQVIRELAGLDHGAKIKGGFDLLSELMTGEGMRRFRDYLKKYPVMNELQKRRVIAAFLDKFAIEEKLIEELDLPGWSDDLVDEMTEIYDEDLLRIQRIPGVATITP